MKEIFYSICGEGTNTGRAAVFCRFAGCNLWSGRDEDRAKSACPFCDTDFVGGTKYGAAGLVDALLGAWPRHWRLAPRPFVVLTGGEPALQVDTPLIDALHGRGFEVAIETNGTRRLPPGIDHVCVSPKMGTPMVVYSGHELKFVFPQVGLDPASFEGLAFGRFYLQPMDGPDLAANTEAAVRYCLEHPRWRISVQLHKQLGLR